MTHELVEFEQRVKAVVTSALHECGTEFECAGVTPGEVMLTVRNASEPQREAEICVYFYRGTNIVDALEFHVSKRGRAAVQIAEVASWLVSALRDVVDKASRGQRV